MHNHHSILKCRAPYSGPWYLYLYKNREKKTFKEIMHSRYMTNKAMPLQKKLCPWGHGIYNIYRPLLYSQFV